MRLNHWDNFNGVMAFSFAWATFQGWTIQEWASLAALVYTLFLIVEKCIRHWHKWKGKADAPDNT
jgi:hypothetical protein